MQTDCFPDAVGHWRKGPIASLALVNPRYRIKKGHEYPFVEMASVGERFAGILKFDRRLLEGSGLSRFKAGDTLFAKITPCPQNGKIAFVETFPADVGLGSTEFIVLSPRHGTVPRFLYHLACSHAVRGRAAARMEGSTGRQRVPDDVFERRLLVPLPDADDQYVIAHTLDGVDTALRCTRAALDRARELRRSCMNALMPPWIGFRHLSCTEKPADVADIVRADTLCHVSNGSTPSRAEARYWRQGTVPWLATGKVHERVIAEATEFVTEAALDECSIRLLPAGTVLVAMIGQGRTRGMSAYLDFEACINQNFGAFTAKRESAHRIWGKWLFYYFDFHYSRIRELGGGTNQGALNGYSLKRLRIPLPLLERQKQVANVLDGIELLASAHEDVLAALAQLKKSLMDDLFTGRINIRNSLGLVAI